MKALLFLLFLAACGYYGYRHYLAPTAPPRPTSALQSSHSHQASLITPKGRTNLVTSDVIAAGQPRSDLAVESQPEKMRMLYRSKVRQLIGVWRADQLEQMRPRSVSERKGFDTTEKTMQGILVDIREELFRDGRLSPDEVRKVLAQGAQELGNSTKDAELIARSIIARAKFDERR